MKENELSISNKSYVLIKLSLIVAVLVGLVVFNMRYVHAIEPETNCYDGIDNDGDELVDCEDTDCDGEYCGNCLDNDCLIDQNPFSFDFLISGTMTCIDSTCSSETCEYDHFCADDDLLDSITVSCHAECDEDDDCGEDYCDGNVRYYDAYCDISEDCTCSWYDENCDGYDGWYDTGETKWVDVDQCNEKEQKEQEYQDWYCYENAEVYCDYIIDTTQGDNGYQWVDTGNTRYKPESTPCDDGLFCSETDHCDGEGSCVQLTERNCSDDDECTYDICNEELDMCENPHKDEEPPKTDKFYDEPWHYADGVEWITSGSAVWFSAEDKGPEGLPECTTGVDKIWYKDIYLPDEEDWHYCYEDCGEWVPSGYEDEGWVEFTEPFYKTPQSCHIIEFYSVDKLGNKEEIKWQCVFVDNTPPDPVKETDEPKEKWDGSDSYFYPEETVHCWDETEDEIECWKVTTETNILMKCMDSDPHPVEFKELCYRVERNTLDKTEEYCDEELTDGWCCINDSTKELVFKESCEHELEFYCVDELDNTSPPDIEKFKVGGERFEIQLNEKWNLISVPFILLSGDPEDVFDDVKDEVLLVLTYDAEDPDCLVNDGWCIYIPETGVGTIEEIKPGWGYWVLTKNATILTVVGYMWSEGVTPPSRSLVEGWNLIGYYGLDGLSGYYGPAGGGKQAFCALHSLVNEYNEPKWDALITYWYDFIILGPYCDYLDPGAGYWVGMNVADPDYRYAEGCSGNTCP